MKNPYKKISLSQLYILFSIIAQYEIRNVDIVRRRYIDKAMYFEETLSFLEDVKIIKNKSGVLNLNVQLNLETNLKNFKKLLLINLFNCNNFIYEILKSFLVNFRKENNMLFFRANEINKSKYSYVRNLLIELEFIFVHEDNRTYIVNNDYSELFLSIFRNKLISPERFARDQKDKERIGYLAEKAIIEFEIKRLSNIQLIQEEIEHTSQINLSAGYDIRSFENFFNENRGLIYRYIEVKAVSIEDFKFFWSRNEIDIAKILGESYYLYLVPKLNDSFDLDNLLIINDPYTKVYLNKTNWQKVEENVSFTKIFGSE